MTHPTGRKEETIKELRKQIKEYQGQLDKAVDTTRQKIASRLGAALQVDILDSITGEKLE